MNCEVMINILMLLLERKKATASELASRYGVSVRSVYRYVDELCVCGVPIDVERGRYGGLKIADTYKLPTGYFTRDEYAATLNALDAMISQVGDENLKKARRKLESRQKVDRKNLSVCGNVIVDGGNWGDGKKFTEKMKICEQAVNECRSLHIDYYSREGEHSKRFIDPYLLIYKQNVWYVYAFCHTKLQFRTFKIGRIKSATFSEKTFTRQEINRDEIDLNFFYTRDELVDVTFKIAPAYLSDAEDWLGIDALEQTEDGFKAQVRLPNDDCLVNKILGYGGAVQVVSPQSLKEKLKDAAKKIAAAYDA